MIQITNQISFSCNSAFAIFVLQCPLLVDLKISICTEVKIKKYKPLVFHHNTIKACHLCFNVLYSALFSEITYNVTQKLGEWWYIDRYPWWQMIFAVKHVGLHMQCHSAYERTMLLNIDKITRKLCSNTLYENKCFFGNADAVTSK